MNHYKNVKSHLRRIAEASIAGEDEDDFDDVLRSERKIRQPKFRNRRNSRNEDEEDYY